MQIHTIGIDLGKTVFHLVGLNLRGEAVVRKKCSRTQLLQFTANIQVDLIGMETCAGGTGAISGIAPNMEIEERSQNAETVIYCACAS